MKLLGILLLSVTLLQAADRVDNGTEPKGKARTIVFEEDLRIGASDGEDYHMWTGSTTSVEVDQQGYIYVADAGGNRIVIFDNDGEFVREHGRKGNGPGEFQGLYNYILLDKGGAVAFVNNQNTNSFHYFDEKHQFVRSEPGGFNPFIQSAMVSPDGQYFAATWVDPNDMKEPMVHSGLMDANRKPVLTITEADRPTFDPSRAGQSSWWTSFLGEWFKIGAEGVGIIGFGPNGTIYTARTNEYEITQYNAKLEKQRVITRAFKPIYQNETVIQGFVDPVYDELVSLLDDELASVITPKVVQDALTAAEFPPRKPPIFALLPMPGGELLVVHDADPIKRKASADIFDAQGNYVGKCELPPLRVNLFSGFFGTATRMVFHGNHAYTVLSDEDGEYHMVRYKYTWQ